MCFSILNFLFHKNYYLFSKKSKIYYLFIFIHIYSESAVPTKLPAVKKVLLFTFTIPTDKYNDPQEAISSIYPLMSFVFQCMERIKRLRISKEAKSKAEKNRLRVEEAFLKTTHAARAEAAAARKEEKKRLEKERILKVKINLFILLFGGEGRKNVIL